MICGELNCFFVLIIKVKNLSNMWGYRNMQGNLIDQYIKAFEETHLELNDYSNKSYVKRANRAATKMRKIASQINNSYPELKDKFNKLLDAKEIGLDRYVAHHILELMNYEMNVQNRAISIIEDVARSDELVNSLGNLMWLIDWYNKHPEFEPKEDILSKYKGRGF